MQGLIMCSMPTGFILGSILINRFVSLGVRQRLIRPFAVLAPLSLVFALTDPNVYGVAVIAAVAGFAAAALLPSANGLFVQALPNAVRARAFGVMQSGVQVFQGLAVFTTGALASRFQLPVVVCLWGAGGVVLMLLVSLTWPSRDTVADEIERAQRMNEADNSAADNRGPRHAGRSTGDRPGIGRPVTGGGRHRLRATSR
jgi:MFS family permease